MAMVSVDDRFGRFPPQTLLPPPTITSSTSANHFHLRQSHPPLITTSYDNHCHRRQSRHHSQPSLRQSLPPSKITTIIPTPKITHSSDNHRRRLPARRFITTSDQHYHLRQSLPPPTITCPIITATSTITAISANHFHLRPSSPDNHSHLDNHCRLDNHCHYDNPPTQ